MDGIVVAFFVPAVIFLTIVAPVWIYMHYRSKQLSYCHDLNFVAH